MRPEVTIAMPRGSVLRLEDAPGLAVRLWSGALWVTQEGDRRDYHLSPGQSFQLDREGVTLVSATRRSLVTLTAPGGEEWSAGRMVLSRAGSRGPVHLYPTSRPELVRKLLARIGRVAAGGRAA